jgi:hypothetical protein
MESKPFIAGREERAPLRVLCNGAGAAVISAPLAGTAPESTVVGVNGPQLTTPFSLALTFPACGVSSANGFQVRVAVTVLGNALS